MTTTTHDTTGLTPLDRNGITKAAIIIAHAYAADTNLKERSTDVYDLIRDAFSDPEMRLVARFLGAMELERAVWPDRRSGQDDPPLDGFLGRAIDKVIEELTPLVEARNPRFLNFVETEFGPGGPGTSWGNK